MGKTNGKTAGATTPIQGEVVDSRDLSKVPPQLRKSVFQKGDERIWRKGRPQLFMVVRNLAQTIAEEQITITKRHGKRVAPPEVMTVLEAILRDWATSGDADKQKAFIAYAYGTPPTIQRNETFDINRFLNRYTDADLIRIREGESPIDILFEKLEETS